MQKKHLAGILGMIALGSVVILGSSPKIVSSFVRVLKNNPVTRVFSTPPKTETDKPTPYKLAVPSDSEKDQTDSSQIPDTVLWSVIFGLPTRLDAEAAKAELSGESVSLWKDYFVRQAKISRESDQVLRETAESYRSDVTKLEKQAELIMNDIRSKNPPRPNSNPNDRSSTDQVGSLELVSLQAQKDDLIRQKRDSFQAEIGEDEFDRFTEFLNGEFAKGFAPAKIEMGLGEPTKIPDEPNDGFTTSDPQSGSPEGAYVFGYSIIVWDDALPQRVSGLAGTENAWNFNYDAYTYSCLWRPVTEQCSSYGYAFGYPWAEGYHYTFYAQANQTWCVDSRHGLTDIFHTYEYYFFSTGVCHTFPVPPTPTPTPPCDPLAEDACVSPTPTPTPSPLPSPSATITPIDVVEKYGTANIRVSVFNNSGGTTRFTIRTTNGTANGNATFGNDSPHMDVTGNVTDQLLPIKGITESIQANNIIIEAKLNNSQTVAASDTFTVGVITSLVFEKFESDYTEPDDNPGNGQSGSVGGKRIFPGKLTTADTKDRSLVKVKATVSPTLPNVKVYFRSHDLDDPSANTAPIDANTSVGDDNNGSVGTSKAGDFVVPSGIDCQDPTTGHVLTKIGCTIASNGIATAAFKTTMQPGDNFAVAASLSDVYRDSIVLNATDGSKLINGATPSQTITISGETNNDNSAGLRTAMLTVWRHLHIEVDSMGSAGTVNNVTGNVTSITETACPNPPGSCVPNTAYIVNVSLESNRFENGRIVFRNGKIFPVGYNFYDTPSGQYVVALNGIPSGSKNMKLPAPFTLYDDDDMDNQSPTNAGSLLNGDESETLPAPDTSSTSIIHSTDTPCGAAPTSNCNVFAPGYIVPLYDLQNPTPVVPFVQNLQMSVDVTAGPPIPADVQAAFRFDNVADSDIDEFWAIYLSSAYQIDERWDNDPGGSGVGGITDALNGSGQGCLIFLENTRAYEAPQWNVGPINRNYTLAHEIGHKFGGLHGDSDLMAPTVSPGPIYRTVGTFADLTLHRMRGGLVNGSRLTHP